MPILAILMSIFVTPSALSQTSPTSSTNEVRSITCDALEEGLEEDFLTPEFINEVLTPDQLQQAKQAGFTTVYAGGRCRSLGFKTYDEAMDVVVITKSGYSLGHLLNNLNYDGAVLDISGSAESLDSVQGAYLSGPASTLQNQTASIHGKIVGEHFGSNDQVLVIVRPQTISFAENLRRQNLTAVERSREDDRISARRHR